MTILPNIAFRISLSRSYPEGAPPLSVALCGSAPSLSEIYNISV
jgi:hypothetical protein